MQKRRFFLNAIILMGSSFLLRVLHIGFRVFLAGRIGAAGMGLYQLIFSVFMTAIAVCTSGVSLTVTRITTEAIGKQQPGTIPSAIRKCVLFGLCVGLAAATSLFVLAKPLAVHLLGDLRAASALRILAPGLPFMAMCACFKGYFLAVRKAMHAAMGEVLEQLVTIGVPVFLFLYATPDGLENAAKAVMLGSTLGEAASFLYTAFCYRIELFRQQAPPQKSRGVFRAIAHIALPSAMASTVRTMLGTAENLLIPFGLRRSGMNAERSMEHYGILQGMSFPVLLFPSSFLLPFSLLLVPEISEARARGAQNAVAHTIERALQIALLFSILIAGIFFGFAPDLGRLFYQSTEAGGYLRILSPLVPLLYLDTVVDGILKGLDEQLRSMRYNLLDAVLRVGLIVVLLPQFGIKGYLCILFFSTIFNASLSLARLLKVSCITYSLKNWVVKPLFCVAIAVLSAKITGLPCFCSIALCVLLYLLFLSGTHCFSREERIWFRGVLQAFQNRQE